MAASGSTVDEMDATEEPVAGSVEGESAEEV